MNSNNTNNVNVKSYTDDQLIPTGWLFESVEQRDLWISSQRHIIAEGGRPHIEGTAPATMPATSTKKVQKEKPVMTKQKNKPKENKPMNSNKVSLATLVASGMSRMQAHSWLRGAQHEYPGHAPMDKDMDIYPEGRFHRPIKDENWFEFMVQADDQATRYYRAAHKPRGYLMRKLVSLWEDALSNKDGSAIEGRGWKAGSIDAFFARREKLENRAKQQLKLEYLNMVQYFKSEATAKSILKTAKELAEKQLAQAAKQDDDEANKTYALEGFDYTSKVTVLEATDEDILTYMVYEEPIMDLGPNPKAAETAFEQKMDTLRRGFTWGTCASYYPDREECKKELTNMVGYFYSVANKCRTEFFNFGKKGHKSSCPILTKDMWRLLNNEAAEYVSLLKPEMDANKVPMKIYDWATYCMLNDLKAGDELHNSKPLTKVNDEGEEYEVYASEAATPDQALIMIEEMLG